MRRWKRRRKKEAVQGVRDPVTGVTKYPYIEPGWAGETGYTKIRSGRGSGNKVRPVQPPLDQAPRAKRPGRRTRSVAAKTEERPEGAVRGDEHGVRTKQCKACPWRKDVVPDRDIPGGYCPTKHANLKDTVAEPGKLNLGPLRMMACHESKPGAEVPCVGWLVHQLGEGNNIMLRLIVSRDPRYKNLEVVGEQHERFEDTLPRSEGQE